MPGKFIVFEGLDGSGKTTQLRMYAERLRDAGVNVFETAEPWDGSPHDIKTRSSNAGLRDHIMQRARDGAAPEELTCLFAADRYAHLAHAVEPALDAGCVVLCDRYVASAYAYQAPGLHPSSAPEAALITRLNQHMRVPDVTVVCELDVRTALDRIAKRALVMGTPFDGDDSNVMELRAGTYANLSAFGLGSLVYVPSAGPRTLVAEQVRAALDPIVFGGA